MKKLAILGMAVAGVLSLNVMARADGTTSAPPATQPSGVAGNHEGRPMVDGPGERLERFQGLLKSLDLTDEQKGKIKDIVQPFREKLEAWREANKDQLEKAHADMKAAREAKDKTKMQAAMQELKSLYETAPKMKELIEPIGQVLTADQKAKLDQEIQDRKDEHREKKDARQGGAGAGAGAGANSATK